MAASPPPLILPRGLILMASAWLVSSWIIAIGVRAPVEASSASYTPGVRLMLISVTVGLVIGWPLLRLSQPPVGMAFRRTWLDLAVLVALVQVVLWPLRLVTPWTIGRTTAVDLTIVAWTVLVGALVASAVGSSRAGPRMVAMAACLGLCVAGPAVASVVLAGGLAAGPMLQVGPLMEVHTLTGGGGAPQETAQWRWIGLVVLADVVAWAALWAVMQRLGHEGTAARPRRDEPSPA